MDVEEMERLIAGLPAGSLGKKKVGNRTYWYRPHVSLRTNVLVGHNLLRHAQGATGLRRRACFAQLWDYLVGARQDKVFVLYGL